MQSCAFVLKNAALYNSGAVFPGNKEVQYQNLRFKGKIGKTGIMEVFDENGNHMMWKVKNDASKIIYFFSDGPTLTAFLPMFPRSHHFKFKNGLYHINEPLYVPSHLYHDKETFNRNFSKKRKKSNINNYSHSKDTYIGILAWEPCIPGQICSDNINDQITIIRLRMYWILRGIVAFKRILEKVRVRIYKRKLFILSTSRHDINCKFHRFAGSINTPIKKLIYYSL